MAGGWAPLEDAHVKLFYGKVTAEELGADLGRTTAAVMLRASRLGIAQGYPPWTPEHDKYIENNRFLKSNAEMGAVLGRSVSSIATRLNVLGLRRKPKK